MNKKLLTFFIALATVVQVYANSGIWDRYIIMNYGTTNYVGGTLFNNQNLGTYANTDNFLLKGGQVKTFKNNGDDITSATMYYRVKATGSAGGAFTLLNLPFGNDLPAVGDQLWQDNNQNILFLQGLANGNYDLDVYFEAAFTFTGGSGGSGVHLDNNNGTNYTAHFTINSNLNCAFNLGNDTTICGNNPLILNGPNTANTSYNWSNGQNTQNISIATTGTYSLSINTNGCTYSDSIKVTFITPQNFSLGADVSSCGAAGVTLNTGYTIAYDDDTLTVLYDATQGATQLVNASRVYFHSSVMINGNNAFNTPWIGNWGQNDGLGLMDSLGNNMWRIKINPKTYYGLTPGTQIDSLVMVFRNADGTAVGKDNAGNDIKADYGTTLTPCHSNFQGILLSKASGTAQNILWNTGATTPSINVTNTGTYYVDVTTTCGFNYKDTINVTQHPIPTVSAGVSQAICPNTSATFTASSGFASYLWSNGATTQSITTNVDGDYTLTATDNFGCVGVDLVNLTTTTEPTTSINFTTNSFTVTFTAVCNMASATYKWDFNNDGIIDSQQGPTVNHTYPQNGFYTIKLITNVPCGDDTINKQVNVNVINNSFADVEKNAFEVYPNPFEDEITVELQAIASINKLEIINTLGEVVYSNNNVYSNKKTTISTTLLQKGIYFLRLYDGEKNSTCKLIKK